MKFNTRLNTAILNLRDILAAHSDGRSIEPAQFLCHTRTWFQQFMLPLYPESPAKFLAIRFLLETPESEIPATTASCLGFVERIEHFSYRDRNHFIYAISSLINDLVIHQHPEWLDSGQGNYEYYYCALTDEVVLIGEIQGQLQLNGQIWERRAELTPATRSVLIRAGVLLQ